MCSYGDDGPETMSTTRRKARKQYRCDECGAPIPVGTVYEYTWGKWDGDALTFRQHLECVQLWDDIVNGPCGGEGYPLFGGLKYEIKEHEYNGGELTQRLRAIQEKYEATP
jgi:hypothetical protein